MSIFLIAGKDGHSVLQLGNLMANQYVESTGCPFLLQKNHEREIYFSQRGSKDFRLRPGLRWLADQKGKNQRKKDLHRFLLANY